MARSVLLALALLLAVAGPALAAVAPLGHRPVTQDQWCEACQQFIHRLEDEGCELVCQELPDPQRAICEKLFPLQTCEDILEWLTKGQLSALHVCGRLKLCTKGCPCGRCNDVTAGQCLAEEADRCSQPLRAAGAMLEAPLKFPRGAPCPKGACGDFNTTNCCLHC
eukprot:EG_transcript_21653